MKKAIYRTKLVSSGRESGLKDGFVRGLASMLILSTPRKETMRSVRESSSKALRGDFVRIGMDMRKAAAQVIQREEATRTR